MDTDLGMDFEITMRLTFGDKASHIAGQNFDPSLRNRWLVKWARKFQREALSVDTTPRHQQRMVATLERVAASLNRDAAPSWHLVFALLRVASVLFGRDFVRGAHCHTPTYYQTPNQKLTSDIFLGGDVMQDYYDRKDALSVRSEVVVLLREKGLDDFKISLVLNTTEYEIKKLRRGLAEPAE